MRLRIHLDDDLLREAMQRSGHATQRAAIEAALRLLIDSASAGKGSGRADAADGGESAQAFLTARAGKATATDLLRFTRRAPLTSQPD